MKVQLCNLNQKHKIYQMPRVERMFKYFSKVYVTSDPSLNERQESKCLCDKLL